MMAQLINIALANTKKSNDYTHLQHSEKILSRKVFMVAFGRSFYFRNAGKKFYPSHHFIERTINNRTLAKKLDEPRVDFVEEFAR